MERIRVFDYVIGATTALMWGGLAIAILSKPLAASGPGSSPNFVLAVIVAAAVGGVRTCLGDKKGFRFHKIAGYTLAVLFALAAAFSKSAILMAGGASFALAGALYANVRENQVLSPVPTFAVPPPVLQSVPVEPQEYED